MARLSLVQASVDESLAPPEKQALKLAGEAAKAADRLLDKADAVRVPRRLDEVMGEINLSLRNAVRAKDLNDKDHPMSWLLVALNSLRVLSQQCANSSPIVRKSVEGFVDEFEGELAELGLL